MNQEQTEAVEAKALELFPPDLTDFVEHITSAENDIDQNDERREGFEKGCEHIITHPTDFGLVSKEEVFEFAEWHHRKLTRYAILRQVPPTTKQLFDLYKSTKNSKA